MAIQQKLGLSAKLSHRLILTPSDDGSTRKSVTPPLSCAAETMIRSATCASSTWICWICGGTLRTRVAGRASTLSLPAPSALRTADLNGDGMTELIVTFSKKMFSWVMKKGETAWEDRTAEMGLPAGESMWLFPDDLDVDGDMDLVDMWNGWWYANDGKGNFARSESRIFDPEARKRGHPWDGDGEYQFIDLDNNGFRDITFAGDHTTASGAFLNMGNGTFEEIDCVNGSRRLRKFGDIDGDYDLDMVRCGKTAELYRNETTNLALKLKLIPNSWAETVLGCTVWVYEAGRLGDNGSLIHYRQCFMPRGMHRSTVLDTTLHVGLGTATSADVRVRFASGAVREAKGVGAKTTVTLQQ